MTYDQRIRALQDDFERETGERPTRGAAKVLLDRQDDAAYEAGGEGIASGKYPAEDSPEWDAIVKAQPGDANYSIYSDRWSMECE